MLVRRPWVLWLCLLPMLGGARVDPAQAAPPAKPGQIQLDDVPEPFKPIKGKSPADLERIEASSLFAAGRTEEQKGNLNAALRLYQRALRHEPQSLPILRQVIEVAQQLDRLPEALRYAQKAVELDPSDPRMVWSLADQLTEQNDFTNALKLYETARKLPQAKPNSPVYLSLTMQIGRLSFLLGDVKRAADMFSEVLTAVDKGDNNDLNADVIKTLLGKDEHNLELFGEAFLLADRPELAEKAFAKARERVTDPAAYAPAYAYRQSQVLAKRKQYDAAIKKLDEYFAAKERRYEQGPYELLATLLKALDQAADLLPRLEKLVAADAGNRPVRMYLADQYRQANQPKLAEPIYRELLRENAKPDVFRALVDIYRDAKQYDALLKVLSESVDKTGSVEAIGRQAKAMVKDSDALTGLIAAAEALKKQSNGTLTYGANVVVGMMLLDAKRYDEAEAYFDGALSYKPRATAELLLTWGIGLLGGDRFDAAVSVFRRAIDGRVVDEDNPIFQIYLTMALEMAGKTDEALKTAKQAAQAAGNKSARLESRVAWVLYHAKRYAEAADAYRRLIARFDSDYSSEENRRVMREARLSMSNIAVIQNNLPQAEEWLEQVLDEFPEDVSALNDLGYLWADQNKKLHQALPMLERAVAAEPDNGAYRDSLGWCYYRLGRFTEALAELKKAAEEDDPDGVILDHLADIQLALKDLASARESWQRAIKALEKSGDRAKIAPIETKLKQHAK